MRRLAYVETSIPSFYYETRSEPAMVACREWTRVWWNEERFHYELVTSLPVMEEILRGNHARREEMLDLLKPIPLLPIEPAIGEIVDAYVARRVMPNDPKGDALHLALASFHRCDFLVTWNCAHLANANKFEHIRVVNTLLGLYVPALVTRFELLNWEEDQCET